MAQPDQTYKISLLKNIRFMIFILLLVVFFLINMSIYQALTIKDSDYRFIFAVVCFVIIGVICYAVFRIQSVRNLQIKLLDDSIEYKRSQYENEIINYKDIKGVGFFKKNKDDETHFGFFDGLYIYDGASDKYCFIGISFNEYREIYQTIKSQCAKYNVGWQNIERGKKSLVEELRNLYVKQF